MWKSLKSNTSLKLTSRLSFLESKSSMSLISSKFCQYLKSLSDKLKPNPKMFLCPFTPQIRENDYLRQCLTPVQITLRTLSPNLFYLMNFLVLFFPQSRQTFPAFRLMWFILTYRWMYPLPTLRSGISYVSWRSTKQLEWLARILKECAEELLYLLALFFNISLKSGRVPSSWKRENVTPVFRAGATDEVDNYRSISLLISIPSKCQEKIVHKAIYSHVAPFLSAWQHRFVEGCLCATQLVITHHQGKKVLDDRLQVDVVFLGGQGIRQSFTCYPSAEALQFWHLSQFA